MGRLFIGIGAISGLLGVVLGAFGAHALKSRLSPELLNAFEVGVRYQLYHALALVLVGIIAGGAPSALLQSAGWAMLAGTVLFSGSLYALALSGVSSLGAITPFGGLAFIAGWALFAFAVLRGA